VTSPATNTIHSVHYISVFIGDQRNASNGEVKKYDSFRGLSEEFKECIKGPKHSAYFVRGKLNPVHRIDLNLTESTMLIIDGDEGVRGVNAPDPEDVHKALKKLKLNHFIYTTHSHCADKNKLRAVIESEPYHQKDLKLNNGLLLAALAELDIKIKFVKEMNTWSQPWFVPTRDDPDDGMFRSYRHTDGEPWQIQEFSEEKKVVDNEPIIGAETLEKMYENVRTGAEYHTSLRTISFQLIKDGMQPPHVKSFMKNLLAGSIEAGTERWNERFNDVDRLVDGAVERVKADSSTQLLHPSPYKTVDPNERFSRADWPCGFMGDIARDIHCHMQYPNKQIAITAAHVVIAAFSGRYCSYENMGFGRTYDVFAMTAVGKNAIKTSIKRYIDDIESLGIKYLDIQHCTPIAKSFGAKAIHQKCSITPSFVSITAEAGINGKSKAGDAATVKAQAMQAQSDPAYIMIDMPSYSNPLPPVYGVPQTNVNESTKETLDRDFQSTQSGEYGRSINCFASHVPDMRKPKGYKTDIAIIKKLGDLFLKTKKGEDFTFHTKDTKGEDWTGVSYRKILENEKIRFTSVPAVAARFEQMLVNEHRRRENHDVKDGVNDEWAEESRKIFRLIKECLLLAVADFAITDKTEITEVHLDYAEHYINEDNRGRRANQSDFEPTDRQAMISLFEYCKKQTDECKPNYLSKRMGHSKEDARGGIVHRSLYANTASTAHFRLIMKYANETRKDLGWAWTSVLRMGEREGYWVYHPIGKNNARNREYLELNLK
jgi:hypothetical protein